MLIVLISLALGLSVPLPAQDNAVTQSDAQTLQLPDVTLLGEYTVYLSAPAPKLPAAPAARGLSDERFAYPIGAAPPIWVAPEPATLILSGGTAARRYELTSSGRNKAVDLSSADLPSAQAWRVRTDYIVQESVQSRFSLTRSRGLWDFSSELALGLADGWSNRNPESPTDLLFSVQATRRTECLMLDLLGSGGAFYLPSFSPLYDLQLTAELEGRGEFIRWLTRTSLYGNSETDSETEEGERRGLAAQDIELAFCGSRFCISIKGTAIMRGELPSSSLEEHGLLSAELCWMSPRRMLRFWAGAAGLVYDGSLEIVPSGGFELSATQWFTLLFQATAFLRPPPHPDFYAAQAGEGLYQMGVEGGYNLSTKALFDWTDRFGASVSFDWQKGRFYRLREEGIEFEQANEAVAAAELVWHVCKRASGRPDLRIQALSQLGLRWPLTGNIGERIEFRTVGGELVLGFQKIPVEFIIEALWGDFADDGSWPFLFSDWEIISGLTTGILSEWGIGRRHTLRTGVEFFSPIGSGDPVDYSYRFLIGYDIRM